jgi:hypothetical protein
VLFLEQTPQFYEVMNNHIWHRLWTCIKVTSWMEALETLLLTENNKQVT